MEWEESRPLWKDPVQLVGEKRYVLTFPYGRNLRTRESFLAVNCVTLGDRYAGKVKISSYSLQCICSWNFLLQSHAGTLKLPPVFWLWLTVKSNALCVGGRERGDSRKLLLHHLADITSYQFLTLRDCCEAKTL